MTGSARAIKGVVRMVGVSRDKAAQSASQGQKRTMAEDKTSAEKALIRGLAELLAETGLTAGDMRDGAGQVATLPVRSVNCNFQH